MIMHIFIGWVCVLCLYRVVFLNVSWLHVSASVDATCGCRCLCLCIYVFLSRLGKACTLFENNCSNFLNWHTEVERKSLAYFKPNPMSSNNQVFYNTSTRLRLMLNYMPLYIWEHVLSPPQRSGFEEATPVSTSKIVGPAVILFWRTTGDNMKGINHRYITEVQLYNRIGKTLVYCPSCLFCWRG